MANGNNTSGMFEGLSSSGQIFEGSPPPGAREFSVAYNMTPQPEVDQMLKNVELTQAVKQLTASLSDYSSSPGANNERPPVKSKGPAL